jgi:ribosome maturation factor RimP
MRSGVVGAGAVRELIEPTISGLGYELVDVQRAAHGLLRITVDTPSAAGGIGLDDCERISRQLTHLMAVEQIDYERLEVSSPGLDRPLTGPRDFVRFTGMPVQLQLKEALQGRRRFQGRLLGLGGEAGAETVRLAVGSTGSGPGNAGGGRTGAPVGRPPAGQPQARKTARKTASSAQPPEAFEVPLAAIEKARLIPQFDFRGAARSGGGPEQAARGKTGIEELQR